jgi:hypothetical protein
LEADSGHEAFLAEKEGIDTLLQGRCGKGFVKSLVGHDEVWHSAKLESIGLTEVVQ